MTAPGPFKAAAVDYFDAGWHPVVVGNRPSQKSPVETGTTGRPGVDHTLDDILERTIDGRGRRNVGMRMPAEVIGIDVDHYDHKRGGDTLVALEAELGTLGATWISTSRDFPSGIRFYRVPPGVEFRDDLVGIEIIQRHHRYAVVWPSMNPDSKRRYRWITPGGDDAPEGIIPTVTDLPDLPDVWVEHLRKREPEAGEQRPAAGPPVAAAVGSAGCVDRALGDALGGLTGSDGSRHRAMLAPTMTLVRYRDQGYPGADAALDRLERDFMATLTPDRGERVAVGEWQRLIEGAEKKIAATPSTIPRYEDTDEVVVGEYIRRIEAGAYAPPADPPPADTPEPSSWAPQDLGPAIRGDIKRTPPDLLHRRDGEALFYSAAINGIHGRDGSGKSLIATEAGRQDINAGHHVIWIDLEDPNPATLIGRFKLMGVADADLLERLHYIRPQDPAAEGTVGSLLALVEETGARLVVIDSMGEALALHDGDEDRDPDVSRWVRSIERPLEAAGCAVLRVDHSTKSKENKLDPSGSKRKRATFTGAGYFVEAVQPFDQNTAGRIRLTCAKDRHGTYGRGRVAAEIDVDPGPPLRLTVRAPLASEAQQVDELDLVASQVAQILEDADGAMTQRELVAQIGVKVGTDTKRAGIDRAARTHPEIRESRGSRNARLFEWVTETSTRPTAPDRAQARS